MDLKSFFSGFMLGYTINNYINSKKNFIYKDYKIPPINDSLKLYFG